MGAAVRIDGPWVAMVRAEKSNNAMASDGNFRVWVSCARKRSFGSRRNALGHATGCLKEEGKDLGVYYCGHCGGWHTYSKRGKR